jgi:(p)ppGpp synthase/HD superfamily hydrolase
MQKNIVQQGIELATVMHDGQFRKEHCLNGFKIPFIVHPIAVMFKVFVWGAGSETNQAAAACHDILEDTNVDAEVLKGNIGEDAYNIVCELTNTEPCESTALSPGEGKFLAGAKEAYLKSFATKSIDALIIKVADRLLNVMDFYRFDHKYAVKYFHKADSIWEILDNRWGEIEAKYGSGTVIAIKDDIEEVKRKIGA